MLCRCNRSVNILLLGQEGAGKTSFIRNINQEDIDNIIPTVGFNYKKFKWRKKIFVTLYDIGGAKSLRYLWENYYCEIYGIIYIIDSTKCENIQYDKQILINLLSHQYLNGKPFLIFANKKDKPNSLSALKICQYLDIPYMATKHSTFIYYDKTCCAKVPKTEIAIPQEHNKNKLTNILKGTKARKVHPKINNAFESDLNSINSGVSHINLEASYPQSLNPFSEKSASSNEEPKCSTHLFTLIENNNGCQNIFDRSNISNEPTQTSPSQKNCKNEGELLNRIENYNERLIMGVNWLMSYIDSQYMFLKERIQRDSKTI